MAWVCGIREVRQVTLSDVADQLGLRRGPVLKREVRAMIDLQPECWQRLMNAARSLPVASGAGPCGTLARGLCRRRMVDPNKFVGQRWTSADVYPMQMSPSPFAWSIAHLIVPLAHHYATYVAPMHFGPKQGPRGRRVA